MLKDNEKLNNKTPTEKGGIAEMLACTWLLLEGYSVYKNVCAFGAADLVALRDGEIILVDVAISSAGGDSKRGCAEQRAQEGRDIKFLYVMPDGSCKWRDEVFKMEKRVCLSCGHEYDIKERSTRKRCDKCAYWGRPMKEQLTVKQSHKQAMEKRLAKP